MSAAMKSHPGEGKSSNESDPVAVKSGLVSFLFLVFVRFLASIATSSSSSSSPNTWIATSILHQAANESFQQDNAALLSEFACSSMPIWEKTESWKNE